MRTKYFPSLAQSFTIFCVYHVNDGMTIAVVSMPDGTYAALAPKIPELKDGRRKCYRTSYKQKSTGLIWGLDEDDGMVLTVLSDSWPNLVRR